MALSLIELSEGMPFAIKHYYIYPGKEANKGQLEVFDIVKADNHDIWLATVYKVTPYLENKWCVAFVDDVYVGTGRPKTYIKATLDETGEAIIFDDEIKAVQWAIKELFINAI